MKNERKSCWLQQVQTESILTNYPVGFPISCNAADFTVLGQIGSDAARATFCAKQNLADLFFTNILRAFLDGSFQLKATIAQVKCNKMIAIGSSFPSETVPTPADSCLDYWASSTISRAQNQSSVNGFSVVSLGPPDSAKVATSYDSYTFYK